MIKMNGQDLEHMEGRTLAEWLSETKFDPARIAVEKNGQIVPKRLYAETVLEDGDILEVVSFVGGG